MVASDLLSPVEVINFFVQSGGRSTNMQLVRQFGQFLNSSAQNQDENKAILKAVTGHIATVRKQGGDNGGKVIILKNQFNGKSGEDIWSSLLLSLPLTEISKMAPRDQIDSKGEAAEEEEEAAAHKSVESKSEHESDTVEDAAVEKGLDEEEISVDLVAVPLEAAASKKGKMSKTKTVKDLRQEYDKFASTSSLTLADHVSSATQSQGRLDRPPLPGQNKRVRAVGTASEVGVTPLSKEGHAWLMAATRADYQTLSRLLVSQPGLVTVREPSTGYTALHWAAKLGSEDIVKLVAGTQALAPDTRSRLFIIRIPHRGGYTPLMLAGQQGKLDMYNLLLTTYRANPDLRDYSGKKAGHYLQLSLEGGTDAVDSRREEKGEERKSRRAVARAATHNFMQDLRSSMRDVRGSLIKQRPRTFSTTAHPV